MKILFMIDKRINAGSIQAVANYVRAGDKLGHTTALYGHPDPNYPGLRCSTDVKAFDYVLLIVEFGLRWMTGLRMLKVLSEVPRERRAIFDTDGMYNAIICVDGYDRNHANEHNRLHWVNHCDALGDKILQPTPEPLEANVITLPFYGYDPSLQMHGKNPPTKRLDIMHIGHNWWRWREMSTRLLPAIERIRADLDGICFVGLWWGGVPEGAKEVGLDVAFGFDSDWFRRLGIEVRPAVPYTEVISAMSEGRINIMTQRPLFRRLKLLTSKYFEIFCADTIPLVMLDPDHAELVYGPVGRELALNGDIADKLLDVLSHPKKYREIVQEVRQHLVVHHSYHKRMRELVEVLEA
jgi:hypothetical protein